MNTWQSDENPTGRIGEPPRVGVCPACWGWSFHRDGCSLDDGKPRLDAELNLRPGIPATEAQ